MPYRSSSQLRLCFSRRPKGWDCEKWLKETPSVCCLPNKKGSTIHHRCMKKGERIIGKIQTGARGGKYFTINEKDSNGEICTIKVYIPRRK